MAVQDDSTSSDGYLAGPPQELLPSYRNKWIFLVEVVLKLDGLSSQSVSC